VRRHHQPDHDPHDQQSQIHNFTPPGNRHSRSHMYYIIHSDYLSSSYLQMGGAVRIIGV